MCAIESWGGCSNWLPSLCLWPHRFIATQGKPQITSSLTDLCYRNFGDKSPTADNLWLFWLWRLLSWTTSVPVYILYWLWEWLESRKCFSDWWAQRLQISSWHFFPKFWDHFIFHLEPYEFFAVHVNTKHIRRQRLIFSSTSTPTYVFWKTMHTNVKDNGLGNFPNQFVCFLLVFSFWPSTFDLMVRYTHVNTHTCK